MINEGQQPCKREVSQSCILKKLMDINKSVQVAFHCYQAGNFPQAKDI